MAQIKGIIVQGKKVTSHSQRNSQSSNTKTTDGGKRTTVGMNRFQDSRYKNVRKSISTSMTDAVSCTPTTTLPITNSLSGVGNAVSNNPSMGNY